MLSELGQNVHYNMLSTWGRNELVYYFNSESKMYNIENKDKFGSIYKLLTCIYINPIVKKINFAERSYSCYTLRKAKNIHKNGIKFMHSINSFEIIREHSMEN